MDIVIQQRPNNPLAYFFRGYAKQRLQRYHEAIVDLTNTNALNFITSVGIAPHPPLSPAGRGEGEGAHCQKTKRVCIKSIDDDPYEDGPGLPVAMRIVFLEKPISP